MFRGHHSDMYVCACSCIHVCICRVEITSFILVLVVFGAVGPVASATTNAWNDLGNMKEVGRMIFTQDTLASHPLPAALVRPVPPKMDGGKNCQLAVNVSRWNNIPTRAGKKVDKNIDIEVSLSIRIKQ